MNNNLDRQYLNLITETIKDGNLKEDRTGIGTKSIFGRNIRHNMRDGFPLLTSKNIFTKGIIEELLWFLRGETNIKPLVDKGVNIWVGDAYKSYINTCRKEIEEFRKMNPGILVDYREMSKDDFIQSIKEDKDIFTGEKSFAEKHGNLGPVYGKQWRCWYIGGHEIYKYEKNADGSEYPVARLKRIDQISNLINDLKENPDSRRLMVSAWNVKELQNMVLSPCHYAFQCYTTLLTPNERYKIWFENNYETGFEYNDSILPDFDNPHWVPTPTRKLSLMWQQRSVDTFLGLPFNIASYGFLLTMLAQQVNMVPDELIGNLGDTHLYLNHLEQAEKQLVSETYELPKLKLNKAKDIFNYSYNDFKIINYNSSNTIKGPLNN